MRHSWLKNFALVGAVLGCSALAIRFVQLLRLAIDNGGGVWMGLVMYLGYFTILTNMLAALVLTAQVLNSNQRFWRFWLWPGVITAIAAANSMVGLVYFLVLRQLWSPQGWHWLADVILHYVMPLWLLVYWWCAVPGGVLRWRSLPRWMLYPAAYFAYVLLRGAITSLYPYPFLDVAALGLGRVVVNAVTMFAAFAGIMLLLIAVNRSLRQP